MIHGCRVKSTAQVNFFLRHAPKPLICQTDEIWVRNGRYASIRKRRHKKHRGMIFERSLPALSDQSISRDDA